MVSPNTQDRTTRDQHRHAVYASETTGLLVIAVLLLVLIVVRYWNFISWSLR